MKNYQRTLRHVGMIWIMFGVINLIYFAYCIAHGVSYSSGWPIMAVILGILLLRGNLKVASWVGDAAAFFLIGFCIFFLPLLLMRPPTLWMVEFRLYPIYTLINVLFYFSFLLILGWTHQQLRNRSVLKARTAAGISTQFPKPALAWVAGLMVVLAFILYSALNGEDAAEAKRLAQAQLGDRYAYYVTQIQWSGNRVAAHVTAYSDTEIRFTTVTWSKNGSR